jgi:hypothetical protein
MKELENLLACLPGGIERQEADGQRTLVAREMLPKEIWGATREQLTAIGFKFGADVDALFVECELPPGWTKKATDHAMHSHLLDDKGQRRAWIYYKASFYDRVANMQMARRFSINVYMRIPSMPEHYRCAVLDSDKVVFTAGEWYNKAYSACDELEKTAVNWLRANYPDWKNVWAYWDEGSKP